MIELTVVYSKPNNENQAVLVFTAQYSGPLKVQNEIANVTLAKSYIYEAISSERCILNIGQFDAKGSIFITYDSSISDWKLWYIKVIDALKLYYAKEFIGVREVVTSIEPLTTSEVFHDQSVQYHPY